MKDLWRVIEFIRSMHVRLRFGELSRAPLRLLRLEWKEDSAEIDWLARSGDAWDADLGGRVQAGNASAQALRDAMAVRQLLLGAFPEIQSGTLRAFRQASGGAPELIIAGTVDRGSQPGSEISSLVMRAKLSGFDFSLEDGVLGTLQSEAVVTSSS